MMIHPLITSAKQSRAPHLARNVASDKGIASRSWFWGNEIWKRSQRVLGAASNSQFAQIYLEKYLQPRQQAFSVVIDRAKTRQELQKEIDADLVFNVKSSIMLYALLFPPATESWTACVRCVLTGFLK